LKPQASHSAQALKTLPPTWQTRIARESPRDIFHQASATEEFDPHPTETTEKTWRS